VCEDVKLQRMGVRTVGRGGGGLATRSCSVETLGARAPNSPVLNILVAGRARRPRLRVLRQQATALREAAGSTCTLRIETPVTDLLPLKAGANPAAFAPRADLLGMCTIGNRPPIVVDVAVVLPHNSDVPGEPVPAGTAAAHKAVAGKRTKHGVNHVAALEPFSVVTAPHHHHNLLLPPGQQTARYHRAGAPLPRRCRSQHGQDGQFGAHSDVSAHVLVGARLHVRGTKSASFTGDGMR